MSDHLNMDMGSGLTDQMSFEEVIKAPMQVNLERASELLKEKFGYNSFRLHQEESIKNTLAGRDALIIMPTGGGKSICYQIPALIQEGLTVVVSPLIALMNDQVLNLKHLGIAAEALHSNVDLAQQRIIENAAMEGSLKLVYMSPEKINSESAQMFLKRLKLSLIAIDESHCVSIWGNDFRPDYVQLGKLRLIFPKVPIVALTATADAATRDDIVNQLQLKNPAILISSFERKNITSNAVPGLNRMKQITQFLDKHKGECGIIYCSSRKSTETVALTLRNLGIKTGAYHAGLKGEEREFIQKQFQEDKIHIICATIAFGMGIDKPNIRFVIHYNMPKNLESYYQEIGRAGRDGRPADALLFYSWSDVILLQSFIDDSEGNETFKEVQRAKLQRMWEFSTTSDCRNQVVLNYFGEYTFQNCGHCDNCLNPPIKFDGTQIAQKALAAVYRSEQSLTLDLTIDVLRGSYKKEIKDRNLDQIKTFGVGRDKSYMQWRHYLTQLINQGLLMVDFSDRSLLKWTPMSKERAMGEIPVSLVEFVEEKAGGRKKEVKEEVTEEFLAEPNFVEQLKKWRLQESKKRSVPAYIVLSNATLEEIAKHMPTTMEELEDVNGIGKVKLREFGEAILEQIKSFGQSVEK